MYSRPGGLGLLGQRPRRPRRGGALARAVPGRVPLCNPGVWMTPTQQRKLAELLERLVRHGGVPEHEFDPVPVRPEQVGLNVANGLVLAPPGTRTLCAERIRAALSPAATGWMKDLRVHLVVDSTNTIMVEAARSGTVDGLCWFAELQTAGRGRRGRTWLSHFARNLTVSMGFVLGGLPKDAGALSLAVGLAVADLMERLGVADVALKWPNDVLVGGAKICGILIELVAQSRPLECVVGIGLNLDVSRDLRVHIDQEVADLRQFGVAADRDELAAALVSSVVRLLVEFRRAGFGGMRRAYDEVHICHGKPCRVSQGDRDYEGIVQGVTDNGELRLRGPEGEWRFNGGEVSLRWDGR